MKINSHDIERLKEMTERQLGHGLHTPADFDKLIIRIMETSRERISLSTLKRIWGYIQSPHTPSLGVLSILARFNGYKDWVHFCSESFPTEPTDDSGFLSVDHVAATDLAIGERVKLEWGVNKGCILEKINHECFRVISSTNIKLEAGDTINCSHFCTGLPFYATNIRQKDGNVRDAYMGARKNGGIRLIIRNA